MEETIFIQIASYRDPELIPTLENCLANAENPENLRFGIAWQHSTKDEWDVLDKFKNDSRFRILDINYSDSKGVCWARNQVQQLYKNEKYTMQLDSHHRFVENWDSKLIKMIKQLQDKGHSKPLLTAYLPSYDPKNDPQSRIQEPWWMTFDRFIPEGAVFFLPASIPDWKNLNEPIPARFYSAHFAFTLGEFCNEVPHDPNMYFHGEEISIAVRAYTHGYDLFHPHRVIAWHEYTREGRKKHWDDDKEWVKRNQESHRRNRILFNIEPGCTPCMRKEIEPQYDFGKIRTLRGYEQYAGIRFKDRGVQRYTSENNFAPNPFIKDLEEYDKSFEHIFKHCIDIYPEQVPLDDYEFWVVAFHDEEDNTIHRMDASADDIKTWQNSKESYYKLWRKFHSSKLPKYWVVWPFSSSQGWCERIVGHLY